MCENLHLRLYLHPDYRRNEDCKKGEKRTTKKEYILEYFRSPKLPCKSGTGIITAFRIHIAEPFDQRPLGISKVTLNHV